MSFEIMVKGFSHDIWASDRKKMSISSVQLNGKPLTMEEAPKLLEFLDLPTSPDFNGDDVSREQLCLALLGQSPILKVTMIEVVPGGIRITVREDKAGGYEHVFRVNLGLTPEFSVVVADPRTGQTEELYRITANRSGTICLSRLTRKPDSNWWGPAENLRIRTDGAITFEKS